MEAPSGQMPDAGHAAVLARRDERDRWLAALLAPAAARPMLHALYAFNAEIARTRDAVSEPVAGLIRLQWWREAVEGIEGGAAPGHPVAEALAATGVAGRLGAARLTALIDAREADLDDEGFPTTESFLAYLDATAGRLNQAALGLLGADSAPARDAARHAGRAHGIAGHLRAAAVNAARGRVTLPRDALARHGVALEEMLAGRPGGGLAEVARTLAAVAGDALASARTRAAEVPRDALPVLALARFTDAYLGRLAGARYDLFSGRLEPPPAAGPLCVLKVLTSGRY